MICLAGAIGALAAFEYSLYALFQIGTCASGASAYVIARQCPPGTAQTMLALPVALVAALAAGAGAGAMLGPRAGGFIWSALFVTTGMQFFAAAPGLGSVAFVFFGLSAMFVIMGIAPFFMSTARFETSD
jgi:asparagine N-glycosylation enzyme membrane subunit Stt3